MRPLGNVEDYRRRSPPKLPSKIRVMMRDARRKPSEVFDNR
jgi:uncharacterized protein YneF (UPF0154 family)